MQHPLLDRLRAEGAPPAVIAEAEELISLQETGDGDSVRAMTLTASLGLRD